MVAKVHSENLESYHPGHDFGNYDLTSVTDSPETVGGEGFAQAYEGLSSFEKLFLIKKRLTPVARKP